MSVVITGSAALQARLSFELGLIKGATIQGIAKAALLVRRDAQRNCPVDTGNMRASAYTVVGHRSGVWGSGMDTTVGSQEKPKFKPDNGDEARLTADHATIVNQAQVHAVTERSANHAVGIIGFTAYYSIYQHEDMTLNHPVGEAKFLENALLNNASQILQILQTTISTRRP